MPRASFFLFCALFLFGESAQSEFTATGTREIMSVTGDGWNVSWTVSNALIMDSSHWDSHGEPSLSQDRAIAIARSYLRSHGEPDDRAVAHAELIHPPVVDSRIPFFFYFISFEDSPELQPPKHVLYVLVLLDGSVVTPKLTTEREKHVSSNKALKPTRVLGCFALLGVMNTQRQSPRGLALTRQIVKRGITFTKVWSDEDMIELRIDVSDGTSLFSNQVQVGYSHFTDAVSQLDTFKDHIHGGILDLRFGEFGPEYANGAFHARFYFPKPGKLFITCRQQSDFQDFARKNVAAEATLYLKTEPALLDNFLEQMKALDAKKREDAFLETI